MNKRERKKKDKNAPWKNGAMREERGREVDVGKMTGNVKGWRHGWKIVKEEGVRKKTLLRKERTG